MKVDLYTKIVLTAIAIGLFLNVMKTVSPMTVLAELSNGNSINVNLRFQPADLRILGGR